MFCDDPQRLFAGRVSEVDLAQEASTTVRMVRARTNGVDIGVEFEATPNGARLTKVIRIAAKAGLRVGDLVSAVDGASLNGLGERSMRALAFTPLTGTSAALTVQRDGAPQTVILEVP